MFASHQVELDESFARVRDGLRRGPAQWIPSLVEDRSGRLTCTIGVSFGGHLQRQALLEIGHMESGEGWAVVPVSWRAADADVLFPTFAGELQATGLPQGRCELALVGSYRPPMGAVGELVDRLVLHRVASLALATFLAHVAERLTVTARSAAPGAV